MQALWLTFIIMISINITSIKNQGVCRLTANVPRDSNSPNEKSPKTSLMLIFDLTGGKVY